MKRLVSLISTKGKTPKQATKEAWDAFQKYQKTGEPTIQVEDSKKQTAQQLAEALNSEAERDGELLVQEPSDSMQVHFFRKNPTHAYNMKREELLLEQEQSTVYAKGFGVLVLFLFLQHFYDNYLPFLATFAIIIFLIKDYILKNIAEGVDITSETNMRRAEKLTDEERGKEYLFSVLLGVFSPLLIVFLGLGFILAFLVPMTCSFQNWVNVEIVSERTCKNTSDGLNQFLQENSGGSQYH